MQKIRIYELAKKLGVQNKIILIELSKLGIGGKTHSSNLEPEVASKIEEILLKRMGAAAKEPAPPKEALREKPAPARPENLPETAVQPEAASEKTTVVEPGEEIPCEGRAVACSKRGSRTC